MLAVDEEHMLYLPIVINRHPFPLEYGAYGTAGRDPTGQLDGPWYQWSVRPAEVDPNFIRMVKCTAIDFVVSHNVISDVIQAANADRGSVVGRVWLINNEPVNPFPIVTDGGDSETWQCGRWPITRTVASLANQGVPMLYTVRGNPREAARQYIQMADLIKGHDPSAQVFAGGLLGIYDLYTHWWWVEFVDEVHDLGRLDTIDGVHVHAYPIHSTGIWPDCVVGWCVNRLTAELEGFYDDYIVGQGLGDRPVWITETGSSPWCMPDEFSRDLTQAAVRDGFMTPLGEWFRSDRNPGYSKLFWFIPFTSERAEAGYRWQCSFLVENDGGLTVLGEAWSQFQGGNGE
jgi:hypothetical protein